MNEKIRVLVFLLTGILCAQTGAHSQQNISTNFFAEIYNETMKLRQEEYNTISMTQALQGTKTDIPGFGTIFLYVKQRYGSDANRDYWNNRGELMAGIRVRFLKKVYLALFYERIAGKYFGIENSENPNPYDKYYNDNRYGLIFWQGFDDEFKHRLSDTFPLSFWNEIYSDAVVYEIDSNNLIFYENAKFGLRLLRIGNIALDYYGVNYLSLDKNGDFWNNKFEYGTGLRLKPWSSLDLNLFIELLELEYIGRKDGRYENPYQDGYSNVRVGLTFWYGLGL
jgi:hypothetical protein